MIGYPKIETLYERNPETHKVTSKIRRPEFLAISRWIITEKIHGQNIRVRITPRTPPSDAGVIEAQVEFAGRTDRAQLPGPLLKSLQEIFTPANAARVWEGHDLRGHSRLYSSARAMGRGFRRPAAITRRSRASGCSTSSFRQPNVTA